MLLFPTILKFLLLGKNIHIRQRIKSLCTLLFHQKETMRKIWNIDLKSINKIIRIKRTWFYIEHSNVSGGNFENGSFGSGFFYQDSFNLYLVTARHVVLDEIYDEKGNIVDYKLKSQIGLIKFYARSSDRSVANEMKCDFLRLFHSGNLRFSRTDDILVAKIARVVWEDYVHVEYFDFIERIGERSRINPYVLNLIGNFENTNLGDDVFIFGFPKSLGLDKIEQYDFDRPLLRKGTLAGRNIENQTIVIDCPSFGGNSGGPVVEVFSHGTVRLIGIVVSFVPFTEYWVNPSYKIRNIEIDNSGYSIVEPIDKIMTLIDEF